MKIINAQQAKTHNNYKNTKLKLIKTNAAIWYNKMCKVKGLKPNYINIKTNCRTTRDLKTNQQAVKYRIDQEIKFLYKKKQHLNGQLLQLHLERATLLNGMWQHALEKLDEALGKIMENRYQSMNKKLDILITKHNSLQSQIKQSKTITPRNTQPRIINLTNTTLTQEQIRVISFCLQYALEQKPSTYINALIIETENVIRRLEPKWQNTYRHLATKRIKQIKENKKQNPLHKWQQNLIRKVKEELTSRLKQGYSNDKKNRPSRESNPLFAKQ